MRKLLLLALSLQSCSYFAGKPPLPKSASIEHLERPVASADYNAAIANADIIYFPTERVGSGGGSEPATLLIEALNESGRAFAIGWDVIDARQQPLLDSWPERDANARREGVALLEITGSGRTREQCRSVLRDLIGSNVSHLGLGYSVNLSSSFTRREFAAKRIVEYLRTASPGAKVLVFMHEEDLEGDPGVPSYVAEKIEARQLVFGSEVKKKERARLLTESYSGGASRS